MVGYMTALEMDQQRAKVRRLETEIERLRAELEQVKKERQMYYNALYQGKC